MTDCGICKYYQGKSKCAKGCSIPNDNCAEYEIYKDFIDKTRVIPEGKKYDEGKNRMGLVLQGFSNALWEVGRVGTFGCSRYGENNWQYLDNAKSRYLDALCRHLFQHLQGNKVDEDSGLLHLQHMAWNALALLEFELKDLDKQGIKGKFEMVDGEAWINYENGMRFKIHPKDYENIESEEENE